MAAQEAPQFGSPRHQTFREIRLPHSAARGHHALFLRERRLACTFRFVLYRAASSRSDDNMDDILTRETVAQLLGVYPLTVDWLREHEGLPGLPGTDPRADAAAGRASTITAMSWAATRREVAKMLDRHEDTVTGLLPDGLGAALLDRGGRGKEAIFDTRLVYRWRAAQSALLSELVLRDFQICARAGVTAFHHLPITALLLGDETAPARRPSRRSTPTPKGDRPRGSTRSPR